MKLSAYALVLACLCTNVFLQPLLGQTKQPNFVVFMSDDHSPRDSQPYGATDVRTPNLEQLARGGIRFTRAFCASPACGPSRAAMLTGLWPARNGAEPNHKNKRPEVASLPVALKELGYEVVSFGKIAHGNFGKDYGFDLLQGPNVGITDTKAVAEYLNQRDSTRPICLMVGTRHPHVPWSENAGYDPARLRLPPTHVDTAVTREMRAQYYTDITKSDQLLGEVLALAKEKIKGETLFVYLADHGAQWPFGKWNLYDEGIHVPLLMTWSTPRQAGTTCDAMVCVPDLFPTLIELAGGTAPANIDGRSFAKILRGEATTHRDRVFTTHSGDGDFNVYPIRSVRTTKWKYIRNLHPEFQHHTHISRSTGSSGLTYWETWTKAAESDPRAAAIVKRYMERPPEELYDLDSDPDELNNLASDPKHASLLKQLRGELDSWMAMQGDTQEVFGTPLKIGEPVTLITPGGKKSK